MRDYIPIDVYGVRINLAQEFPDFNSYLFTLHVYEVHVVIGVVVLTGRRVGGILNVNEKQS